MTAPAVAASAAATSGTSPAVAASSARLIQVAIRNRLMLDVARLWPALDPKRLNETFPGWLRAMMLITGNYHGQSTSAAAAFYRTARTQTLDVATPSGLIKRAQAPDTEWMTKAFGFSGPGMLTRDQIRPGTALTTTLGTASRIALDGGRTTTLNTLRQDPKAVGWYRVTDGNPCAFCALLASRGVVYKHDTAGFKSHNECGCTAAPAFRDGLPLPAQMREWQDLYEKTTGPYSGHAKLVAFRQAYEGREVTGGDIAATKRAATRAATPKIGKTGRTASEIRAELTALEANLPKLTNASQVTFHDKRIAELKKLLGS